MLYYHTLFYCNVVSMLFPLHNTIVIVNAAVCNIQRQHRLMQCSLSTLQICVTETVMFCFHFFVLFEYCHHALEYAGVLEICTVI